MLSSPNDMHLKDKAPTTKEVHHIHYADTGSFSKLVVDYLAGSEQLSSFYKYSADVNGIKKAIEDRTHFNYDRTTLVAALNAQYKNVQLSEKVAGNLSLLLNTNTYTVTTAHQPNIFTGPLYFIYKILHAIKLAETLKQSFPDNDFVPVYYMGSEDADLDELGHFTVAGKRYEWKTKQTGAVGRMKIDKAFLSLITELEGQLIVEPFGNEMVSIFKSHYKEGSTLQECTLSLVNALFGAYGLIVLIPDDFQLKKLFASVIKKELTESFSHKAVEAIAENLSKHYKVQAAGRDLNLFYLLDDKRERIEIDNNGFTVPNLKLRFTEAEILNELELHPERFSPNVILRGAFQELILPNIAFIGGGGEIAYWLELRKVFEEAGVPYPVLILRNSFLVMKDKQKTQLEELGFEVNDAFKSSEALINAFTQRQSTNQLSLSEEKGELNSFYQQLHENALQVDASLAEHVNALQAQALKRITSLEKKLLRAEKRKYEAEKRRIEKIKTVLFPNNSLQERVENLSGFYAKEGSDLIRTIYEHSLSLQQQFTVITL
jgi:bacillithiol synthase